MLLNLPAPKALSYKQRVTRYRQEDDISKLAFIYGYHHSDTDISRAGRQCARVAATRRIGYPIFTEKKRKVFVQVSDIIYDTFILTFSNMSDPSQATVVSNLL